MSFRVSVRVMFVTLAFSVGVAVVEWGDRSAPRSTASATSVVFVRGDVDGSGTTNIGDAIVVLDHLFAVGNLPCGDAADVNDDGGLDLADPITLLAYLFAGGPNPIAPFPDCGSDPTVDVLGCVDPGPHCSGPATRSFLLDGSGQVRRFEAGGAAAVSFFPPVPFDAAEWIEVSADGSSYWLIDSGGAVGRFNGGTGALLGATDLGGIIRAATMSGSGALWVVRELAGVTTLFSVDEATLEPGPAPWSTNEPTDLHSIATDDAYLFLSGAIGGARGILRVELGRGDESWIVSLPPTSSSGPVLYDFEWGLVWWIDAQPGSEVRVRGLTAAGAVEFDEPLFGITGPTLGDADTHDEWILVPYVDLDALMSFNRLSLSPEFWWDASDGLLGPIDVSR